MGHVSAAKADGWMDRWMDGWMDGWIDRWMDGGDKHGDAEFMLSRTTNAEEEQQRHSGDSAETSQLSL